MKPARFSRLSCALGMAGIVTLTSGSALADPIYWDGTFATGSWTDATLWSTSSAAAGTNPAAPPGALDTAFFTADGVSVVQTVNLDAPQSVLGITTAGQTNRTDLRGGNGAQILNIGTGGISHKRGGIAIGSGTAGQEVAIGLAGSQTWDSSTAGTGTLAAIVVTNGASITSGGDQTLTLTGINNGAIVNGVIADGAGKLSLAKTGGATSIWTIGGIANTFTGTTTVSGGILRLTGAGSITAANTSVATGATLSLRLGGTTGFTQVQADAFIPAVTFAPTGSILALDTNNANFTYETGLSGNFNLTKLGNNTLTLNGANTYTGKTIITEGSLAFSNPSTTTGGPIEVGANGTLLAVAGGTGYSPTQMAALKASATFAAGAGFGLSTSGGDFNYTSVVDGNLRFASAGGNTLFVNPANTYTGATTISAGTFAATVLANGGAVSSIGASTSAAANLVLNGGRLRYIGTGATTDRLFTLSGSSAIDSSGTGPLVFSNVAANSPGTAGTRTITFTGYNQGENKVSGIIADSGTGVNLTSLTKLGSGNWTFAGANTYTGTTRASGGNLTYDYAAADPVAGKLLTNVGTLTVKAGATRNTDTIPSLQIGENNHSHSVFKLEGGMNLTTTLLEGSSSSQRFTLVDLSGNPANAINAAGIPASNILRNVNGILMNNGSTEASARANFVVRDQTGRYGFAKLTGGSSGTLQALLPDLNVLSGNCTIDVNTDHFLFKTPGTCTNTSADAIFSTMTFESSAGAITFNLQAGGLNPNSTGKGMLFSGSRTVNIVSTSTGIAKSGLWFFNYLGENTSLNLNASFGGSNVIMIGGTGYTNYSGTGFGQDTQVSGGVLRVLRDQELSQVLSDINISGGVFEVGADLNGALEGDLTKTQGNLVGQVRLYGDAGFSAYTAVDGGTRIVDFTLVSTPETGSVRTRQSLVWGTDHFLTVADTTTDADSTFKLSSPRSNATIEFRNPISLNGRSRVIDVTDGSAAIDAVLSGTISGGLHGFKKTGLGTLSLTGTNTYTGETHVSDGKLIIAPGALSTASTVRIDGGGSVNVTGTAYVSSVIIDGVAQPAGTVVNGKVTGTLIVGAPVTTTPYQQWVIDKAIPAGLSDPTIDADGDGIVNLIEYAVGSEPRTPNGSVILIGKGLPAMVAFNRATGRTDLINSVLESSPNLAAPWTPIATSTGGGTFSSSVSGVTVSETAGVVTVTDTRTAPAGKFFYRLHVTK